MWVGGFGRSSERVSGCGEWHLSSARVPGSGTDKCRAPRSHKCRAPRSHGCDPVWVRSYAVRSGSDDRRDPTDTVPLPIAPSSATHAPMNVRWGACESLQRLR